MAQTNFGALAVSDGYAAPQGVKPFAAETLAFFTSGNIAVAARIGAAVVGIGGSIVDVRGHLDTAPVGASAILDVKINGVSAYTTVANRPTFAAAATSSTTLLPDVVNLNPGDVVTIDVLQIGSTTPGANLTISVTIKQALQG